MQTQLLKCHTLRIHLHSHYRQTHSGNPDWVDFHLGEIMGEWFCLEDTCLLWASGCIVSAWCPSRIMTVPQHHLGRGQHSFFIKGAGHSVLITKPVGCQAHGSGLHSAQFGRLQPPAQLATHRRRNGRATHPDLSSHCAEQCHRDSMRLNGQLHHTL